MTETAIRMVAALALILGLLMILLYGLRHWARRLQGGRDGLIEVVATRMILPRKHICIVRVGAKTLTLGVSDHELRLLDMADGLQGAEGQGQERREKAGG